MRLARWFFLVAVLGWSGPASAEDPVVGHWELDEGAFRAVVEQFYAASLLQVPVEQRDTTAAFATQAIEAAVAQMRGSSAVFEADGSVILRPGSGMVQTGTWQRDGDVVRLEADGSTSAATKLVATFEGENLRIHALEGDTVGFLMRRVDP